MGDVGEKEIAIEIETTVLVHQIVLVALDKVAAEKRMCPPEGTLTGFFYQKD